MRDSMCQSFDPTGSLYVETTIPTNEKNLAFASTMEGLFHGGVGYQYAIWNGLTIGGGVNYSFFKINQFSLNQTIGRGGMHIPGLHLKVGIEKFTTDRVSFYAGVRGGISSIMVVNDSCEVKLGGPFQVFSPFIQGQFEINVLTDQTSSDAFNINLGYSIYFREYDETYLCRENLTGLIPESTEGLIRFFNFGFGYKYYFGR